MKEYKIVSGDTLSEIAEKFGTTVSELAKLNNIANPDLIYAGDTIKIPSNEEEEKKAAEAAKTEAAVEKLKAAKAAAEAKAKEETVCSERSPANSKAKNKFYFPKYPQKICGYFLLRFYGRKT